jgi:hypothetical protein
MGLHGKSLVALLGLSLAPLSFAVDPPSDAKAQPAFTNDSSMILPATGEQVRYGSAAGDRACFSMRTYRVRRDMDRGSLIPATPSEAAFDPDDIVGYSTCQRAGKFGVKSTDAAPVAPR